MTTKQEIIQGLEFTIAQAKRTTSLFAEGEWEWKRAAGWTPKEVFGHLTAVAAMAPSFSQAILGAPVDKDIMEGMDLNQMNEQAVSPMRAMPPEQLMQAFEANYGKLIDWVGSLPDEQLRLRRRFFSDPVPVSDVLMNVLVLHALHHMYEAYSRYDSPV